MQRIYFTGASGVGKTTLARWVSENYGIPLVTGASRLTLEKMGITNPGAFFKYRSREQAEDFQQRTFEKQDALESAMAFREVSGYVSDRTILDHLAYMQLNEAEGLIRKVCARGVDSGFGTGLWRLIQQETSIFFVRPCEEIRLAAKDGVRDLFLEPQTQHGIDQTIMLMLNVLQIPYVEISIHDLEARKKILISHLGNPKVGES